MFKLNATKVSREAVEIEMTEDELMNTASTHLSNSSIVKILKGRLKHDIINLMQENDPELRPVVNGRFLHPMAYIHVCLESGFVTKSYNSPYRSGRSDIRTKLDSQYLQTLAVLNQISGMGK